MTADQAKAMKAANAAYLEKRRADMLEKLLLEALPYVESAADDPSYKPRVIKGLARRIREALS